MTNLEIHSSKILECKILSLEKTKQNHSEHLDKNNIFILEFLLFLKYKLSIYIWKHNQNNDEF